MAAGLDRLIHERLRLAILTALAARGPMTFVGLREALKATDGNLAVHSRKLEEAGYVAVAKSFQGRLPRTEYRLTPVGRRALRAYSEAMAAVLRAAQS